MGDPNFSNVTLLMHCDDFSDVVSATNATNTGSVATIDTGTVEFGSGSIKTGASELYFPDSPGWDFGTGPFTIEFWVNFTSTGGTKALISHYASGGPTPNFEFVLQSGALKLLFADGTGPHNSNATTGQTYVAGTWYAVCLERDASNNLRIYVNGVQRSKTTGYTYSFSGFTWPLIIGSLRPGVTAWDALAYFDEIRITKGVARYASDSGYTVQTAPFPDSEFSSYTETVAENVNAQDAAGGGLQMIEILTGDATATDTLVEVMPLVDALADSGTGSAASSYQYNAVTGISDAATGSDAILGVTTTAIKEYASLADSMGLIATFRPAIAEAATAIDKLTAGLPVSLSESASLTWAITLAQGAAIAEKLNISEVLNYPVIFQMSLSERARFYDNLARFLSLDIAEVGTVADVMNGLARHFSTVADTGSAADELVPHAILKAEANDDGVFDDAFDIRMIYQPEIAEQIKFSVAFASPSGGITTWAVNTRTGAVTEYDNFAFNSFAQNGVHYLGASPDGLFALDGDDDDGTPTIAHLKSGLLQFGGSLYSGIKTAYIGMRAEEGSTIYLKIDTKLEGVRVYKGVVQGEQTTKVRLGKGLRARYYSWELVTTGQDFDLDNIEFLPLVAQRRV